MFPVACMSPTSALPMLPATLHPAELDGLVRREDSKSHDAPGNSAVNSVCPKKFQIHICNTLLRPWASKLYRKLRKQDKIRLGLDSTGVTKKSLSKAGKKQVPEAQL